MKKALSIIEVMFALTLVAVIMAASSPVMLQAMRSNGDSRVNAKAVAAAEGWLDRFRAKTLSFSLFEDGNYPDDGEFEENYDYASDTNFVAASDTDPQALNREWQGYKFKVSTQVYSNNPLIWLVKVDTTYKRKYDGERSEDASFTLSTLIAQ